MRFFYDCWQRRVYLVCGSEMVAAMPLVEFEEVFGFRAVSTLLREVWR